MCDLQHCWNVDKLQAETRTTPAVNTCLGVAVKVNVILNFSQPIWTLVDVKLTKTD